MKNKFSYITLTVVASIIASLCACNDELEGIVQPGRATDVLCFSVALSDGYTQSKTRSAKDNLEMEEEEWVLEGVQTSDAKATRGTPTTLLSGSAGTRNSARILHTNTTITKVRRMRISFSRLIFSMWLAPFFTPSIPRNIPKVNIFLSFFDKTFLLYRGSSL